MEQRKKPYKAFFGVIIFGFALYYAMLALEPHMGSSLFDYNTWLDKMGESALWRFMWLIGDGSEPHFHKTILGGLFVLIGSVIAYVLDRKQSKLRLTPISYGNGKIWPWIFAAAFLSAGIVAILFGSIRTESDAWSATFIPYVSVASAVILLYGARIEVLLTGAILGAVFTTPITIFLRNEILFPHQLSGVIGSVSGMWIGAILVFEICKFMPWMKANPNTDLSPVKVDGETPVNEYKKLYPNKYFIRRMLADYSEPMFVGNEIAGACLIVGSLICWMLNPLHPSYGSGLFPAVLLSQIIAGAVAMLAYWDEWMDNDFIPTFVPIVSIAPAMVLQLGGSMFVIIASAVLGALVGPAMAMCINRKIPSHWHGVIGFTASMAICSFGVNVFLRYVLMAFPGLA